MQNPEPVPAAQGKGRRLPLSVPRRVMCDLLSFAKAIPTVPVQCQMNVARVAAARAHPALAADPPGWCAIFIRMCRANSRFIWSWRPLPAIW